MNEYINNLAAWPFIIIAALLGILGKIYIHRLNAYRSAANAFRASVLSNLEGLYPTTTYWGKEVFIRFRQSISRIESAAAEFRPFVPFYRKNAFNAALKNYCDHCNEITWESCAAYAMYPNMREPGEKDPKEIFQHNVDILLSFARNI